MAHVLVIGSANVDRIWRLDEPITVGGRFTYREMQTRCGGGGFNTAASLVALGHTVTLCTRLCDDALGRATLETLRAFGIGTEAVRWETGSTRPLQILVEPSGNRTIAAPVAAESHTLAELPPVAANIAYVNVRRADPALLTELCSRMPVVAQMPLERGQRRPSHVLIGAASDHAVVSREAFVEARRIAGDGLSSFILTGGAGAVRLWSEGGETRIPVPPLPRAPADTTGAGDAFVAGLIDAQLTGASPVDAVGPANAIAARYLTDRDGFWGGSSMLAAVDG
ncbi:carbohydrate kinase family protein [Aurantimonas sp. VKM B-3413]|uniref:carbohydrate kinase family protein n=1 Tax=Aurantimonas sp. VKM B-3413 TaxID=2779401 RepID=UPI001E391ADB|nr:PfkB family carbohydrate kinase [Aurantimonas sp. VKM B-3413]MCB8840160.1 PfkB family carbohydrate kinase [Aurantimonas sp. VKM B-3413]